jgi:hypothetical protein
MGPRRAGGADVARAQTARPRLPARPRAHGGVAPRRRRRRRRPDGRRRLRARRRRRRRRRLRPLALRRRLARRDTGVHAVRLEGPARARARSGGGRLAGPHSRTQRGERSPQARVHAASSAVGAGPAHPCRRARFRQRTASRFRRPARTPPRRRSSARTAAARRRRAGRARSAPAGPGRAGLGAPARRSMSPFAVRGPAAGPTPFVSGRRSPSLRLARQRPALPVAVVGRHSPSVERD